MRELFDLWLMWWSGPLADSAAQLWGRPLWWWERVGTVVQVFAIIGVIFEVIGEQRLHRLADQLRQASDYFKRLFDAKPNAAEPSSEGEDPSKLQSTAEDAFIAVGLGVGGVFGFWVGGLYVGDVANAMARFLVDFMPRPVVEVLFIVVGMSLWLLSIAVIVFLTFLIARPVLAVLFRAMGRILQSPRLKLLLNTIIVLASLFNLHFTLLSQ